MEPPILHLVSPVSTDTTGALRGKTGVIELKSYDDPTTALGAS